MTISATNQGLRPGVCTSSSRPSSPFAGQLIFETDTNRLAVWNGTSWVVLADSDTPPGLELVKTQTIGSAVSSVTVSDAFSATYDNYFLTISDGVASGNTGVNLTLGSTSTGYYYGANYASYASATGGYFNGSNDTALKECCYASANAINLQMIVKNPYLSKRTFFNYQTSGAATSAVSISTQGGGYLDNATSYTAFTLTTVSGTLTGGTIRVYGYRNS